MSKFQISVIDFMSEHGKHPIGEKDSQGTDLHIGDIVQHGDDKHMIAYRYGSYMLRQPMTAHTLGITDWSKVTKLSELWSAPDYMVCGETEEPFYNDVKHLFE